MKRLYATEWHQVTVSYDGPELDYDVEHPGCPDSYDYRCWFDFELGEGAGEENRPTEPGVYRGRAVALPDQLGSVEDYVTDVEWEPIGGES